MITDIKGLHHVTSMAADAGENNAFFTNTLGLRRVKKTVNFDAPEVYHLYYGDEVGTPGSVMTYFPFGRMPRGKRGTGEVGVTEFAVPKGALGFWSEHLSKQGVTGLSQDTAFGENRLNFNGPDGDGFALVETDDRDRTPWTGGGIVADAGILGFNGARFRLKDAAATGELLTFMGYQKA
ncbi:MAG: ring-cleaving dioxygenase, partial [Pseudomonadota bacterium]